MKKIHSIILFLSISIFSFAQEVNIYWGKENPVDHKATTHLIGRRGDLLLGYKRSRKSMSIVKYDFADLQVKGEHLIIGDKGSKAGGKLIDNDYSFNDIYMLKHKTYVCVTKYDRKADKNSIYMQEIDDNGSLTGSFKKLADISATSRRNSGSFLVFPSADSTKILVVNNPPFDKYAGEKFGFKIFDENLSELNNLSIELPYKDKNFAAEDYILGNDGIIYLKAQIFLEKKEKKKEEASYYYEILAINPAGKGEVAEYEIKLSGKFITDISFALDNDKIICSGFYGEMQTKGGIKGIFFMRINKSTKQVEASGVKDLDKDFVADITTRRSAEKGRGLSNSFSIHDFIKRSDGGAILVSEYASDYAVTTCTTDPKTGARSCRTDYHYVRNNIIAININPDGSIKWYANIPKYQHTVNDGGAYISYMMTTKGSNMYFIYNENPKNLDQTKVKTPKDMRNMGNPYKSTAVLVTLNESGTFTKKALFSNKENKMVIKPASAIHISKNEQIVTALNNGMFCCFIPLKAGKSKLARFEFK